MKAGKILSIILGILFLSSRSNKWVKSDIRLNPPSKIRVVVLPVFNDIRITHIKDIHSLADMKKPVENEKDVITKEIHLIIRNLTRFLENHLKKSRFFNVVSSISVRSELEEMRLCFSTYPLTAEQLEILGRALNADAVLETRLLGYGKVKKKWIVLLIGIGMIEGIVQGIAAYEIADNKWVAAAVAGEEIIQELVTW